MQLLIDLIMLLPLRREFDARRGQGMTREKKTEILLQLCLYVHYDWMI